MMEYSSNVGVSVFTQTYSMWKPQMEETQMITDIRRFYEEKINDTGR